MTGTPNPAVTAHMPWFMTAPGATDGLFIAMVLLLILAIVSIGNLYFKLHALPERRAHKANKTQMELVAVLALIALFTHEHVYWILALLLALADLPDFSTPMNSMADSFERLSTPMNSMAESLERLVRGSQLSSPGTEPVSGLAPRAVPPPLVPDLEPLSGQSVPERT
jgi:hypothetical protein